MSKAVTAILYAPGTNCHEETAAALDQAGLRSELVLLRDVLEGRAKLSRFQAAVIPGGFSYGDHLGAGRVFATLLTARLGPALAEYLASSKPLLGICNGFQALAEAGILPGRTLGQRSMALVENQSAGFEDCKVRLLVSGRECLWTRDLAGQVLEMPSAHGEGRPLFQDATNLDPSRVVLRYSDGSGALASRYPENPSGAQDAIAGITDETGFVLGLMPHPERASLPAHYSQDGLKLFKNLAHWLAC
ncbi:MAG TPA: phosphoribosylformylglycinamidine synthase I [Terriglobia bacterium]|nr:phosphoribosylformylglycinamidine synthase I [Terriglobia bacterium]